MVDFTVVIPTYNGANRLCDVLGGIGLSRHPIRMIRTKIWLRGWIIPVYLVNDLRKVIVHFLKYRSVMARDIAAACEMEYYWGTLVSPFYWRGTI